MWLSTARGRHPIHSRSIIHTEELMHCTGANRPLDEFRTFRCSLICCHTAFQRPIHPSVGRRVITHAGMFNSLICVSKVASQGVQQTSSRPKLCRLSHPSSKNPPNIDSNSSLSNRKRTSTPGLSFHAVHRCGDLYSSSSTGYRCLPTSLFIWNMSTRGTLKTACIASSHMIWRLSLGSWSSLPLMCSHSFLTTCGRDS
jgi:hypothetical protein